MHACGLHAIHALMNYSEEWHGPHAQQCVLSTGPPHLQHTVHRTGAIPFVTLTPSFVEAAGFAHLVDYCSEVRQGGIRWQGTGGG